MAKAGAENLMGAVAEAVGRKLNIDNFGDRLLMQKGCFILNRIGVEPKYKFSLYLRGPYSSDLADDYYEVMRSPGVKLETDVDANKISYLSTIMKRGIRFVEAYATLEMAMAINSPAYGDERY